MPCGKVLIGGISNRDFITRLFAYDNSSPMPCTCRACNSHPRACHRSTIEPCLSFSHEPQQTLLSSSRSLLCGAVGNSNSELSSQTYLDQQPNFAHAESGPNGDLTTTRSRCPIKHLDRASGTGYTIMGANEWRCASMKGYRSHAGAGFNRSPASSLTPNAASCIFASSFRARPWSSWQSEQPTIGEPLRCTSGPLILPWDGPGSAHVFIDPTAASL